MKAAYFFIIAILILCTENAAAQNSSNAANTVADSIPQKIKKKAGSDTATFKEKKTVKTFSFKKDTTPVQLHDPHIATRRSAILPGWGQAYNRDYWKIPIVYGVLAIPAATWVYNNTWYHRTRDAYNIVINEQTDLYPTIDPRLQPLISDPSTIQYYRNYFRKSRDYSVLYFLAAWGLNVADATVFAHLKGFDVSDDLSLNIQPILSPSPQGTQFGLNFSLNNKKNIMLPVQ